MKQIHNTFYQICLNGVEHGCTLHSIRRSYPLCFKQVGKQMASVIYRRAEQRFADELLTA